MQLSHYLKHFSCQHDPDKLVFFSTINCSKIRLARAAFRQLEGGRFSSTHLKTLTDLGIMVQDQDAEKKRMRDSFKARNARNSHLTVIAVLNMDCNFSCRYCFEGAPTGDRYMTRATADRLIGFIERKLTPGKEYLTVNFYGGEPLLSVGLIDYISSTLIPLTQSRGVTFDFNLTTNGSLLTRSLVEQLVSLGLRSVTTTLDGPADIHDRYRPFRSGDGSFDLIIRNLKDSWDLVQISVGGNYDQETWPRFASLLDFLMASGLTPDRICEVKFSPILSPSPHRHLMENYHGGCATGHEPWVREAGGVLRKEILKRGYVTPKVQPIMCTIENRNSYVVNFDGTLYKCPAFLGIPEYSIGDIENEVTDYREMYQLDIWKNGECLDCVYLPLCYGGCRYVSYLRDGEIKNVDCKKQYFDETLETLVNQDIAYPRSFTQGPPQK